MIFFCVKTLEYWNRILVSSLNRDSACYKPSAHYCWTSAPACVRCRQSPCLAATHYTFLQWRVVPVCMSSTLRSVQWCRRCCSCSLKDSAVRRAGTAPSNSPDRCDYIYKEQHRALSVSLQPLCNARYQLVHISWFPNSDGRFGLKRKNGRGGDKE